jgi:diketogulonate reductase-like aldo/keto reductase
LERLGVERVDLYIIHWPQGGSTWAWDGMQRARERGYARSIGVSNFSIAELDELLAVADTPPVVNQVQFSPFEYRRALLRGCERRGVVIEAYSPLGTGRHLGDDRVREIADRLGRTPAQVLVRWCLERDLVVLAKSTHRERIEQNAQVFDFALSDDDIAALDALDTTAGTDRARTQMVVTAAPRDLRKRRRWHLRCLLIVRFRRVRPGLRHACITWRPLKNTVYSEIRTTKMSRTSSKSP